MSTMTRPGNCSDNPLPQPHQITSPPSDTMPLCSLPAELLRLVAEQLLTLASPDQCNRYLRWKYTRFSATIRTSDLDTHVRQLLPLLLTNRRLHGAVTPLLIHLLREEKDIILLYAAYKNKMSLALTALALGADVEARDTNDTRALHYAVREKGEEMVRMLLLRGASVNIIDKSGNTPLHFAVRISRLLKLLLKAGADVNIPNKVDATPLYSAILINNSDQPTRLLIQHGATLDTLQMPLQNAIRYGHPNTVRILLQCGADPNRLDVSRNTPLHLAAGKGKRTMVCILLQHGADVNALDDTGYSPLDMATVFGHRLIAEKLIKHGGRYAAAPQDALEAAIDAKSCYGVQVFVENGATVHTPHNALLSLAIERGGHKVLTELLKLGADPNALLDELLTPFSMVASLGNVKMARVLLQYGAEIGMGFPLHAAVMDGRYDMVEFLLQQGMQVNAKYVSEGTLESRWVPSSGQTVALKNTCIDTAVRAGATPLHFAAAARDSQPTMIKLLLDNGANLEARNDAGYTPLLVAAQQPAVHIILALVGHGANIYASGKDGKSSLFLAASAMFPDSDVIRYLLERGMRVDPDFEALSSAARREFNQLLEEMGLEGLEGLV